jgi:hypothetical protein
MRRRSAPSAICIALLSTGCGQASSSPTNTEAGADGAAGTDSSATNPEAGVPDVAGEVGANPGADAPADVLSEANSCLVDVSTTVCCCQGDVETNVVCNADGALGCPSAGFSVFYGADCSRSCGPCTLPCLDATPTSDAGSHNCTAVPADNSMCTSPPHFYRCVTPYKAPSGCTVLTIGNATDLYCCP